MQTLKIGESSYAILFLSHKFSMNAYAERYSSAGALNRKSQYVMEVMVEHIHSRSEVKLYSLVSIRQNSCSKQGNGWFLIQNTIIWTKILLNSYYEDCNQFERFKLQICQWIVTYKLAEKALQMLVGNSGTSWNCSWGSTACIIYISLLTKIRAREQQVGT